MSTMSLAILPLYLGVAALCLAAGRHARNGGARGDVLHWLFACGWFCLLALVRTGDLEEAARQALRAFLYARDAYTDRALWQAPLAALAILLGLAIPAMLWRSWKRAGGDRARQMVILSRLAVLGYLPLFALRLISLHATDQLLYSGPVRLNWLTDGGLAFLAASSAVLYAADLRNRAKRADR